MSIIGNATIIILICYILANLTTKTNKIKISTLLSNVLVLVLLHLILLR